MSVQRLKSLSSSSSIIFNGIEKFLTLSGFTTKPNHLRCKRGKCVKVFSSLLKKPFSDFYKESCATHLPCSLAPNTSRQQQEANNFHKTKMVLKYAVTSYSDVVDNICGLKPQNGSWLCDVQRDNRKKSFKSSRLIGIRYVALRESALSLKMYEVWQARFYCILKNN